MPRQGEKLQALANPLAMRATVYDTPSVNVLAHSQLTSSFRDYPPRPPSILLRGETTEVDVFRP